MDKIPGPWKKGLPLIGNVLDVLHPGFHRTVVKWADEYGPIYRINVMSRDILVVSDPLAVGAIVGRGEGALDKADGMYFPINQMVEPHGLPNLLTSKADEQWKVVRKAVAVSFSSQNIKKKFPVILQRVDELIDRLKVLGPNASVDVDQAALRVTLDVIGLTGFNHDYQSVKLDKPPAGHLLRVLPRCFTEVMLRVANPLRHLTPGLVRGGRKGQRSFKEFQQEMRVLLKEMVDRGPPAEDDLDIAAQLYRCRHLAGITDERILSEIGILFVEGFETTGHTISWTLFNIATTPGVQERIAMELKSLGLLVEPGHPSPRVLELDDLKKLRYLTAVVKESMRTHPVVSAGNGRVTIKPTKVGPYLVPAGVVVGTPLMVCHNTKWNWEKPDEFLPDRWMDVPVETYVYDSTQGAKPVTKGARGVTFMPFSEGPRNCVGQSLAKIEVMAVLARMLSTFWVELASDMGGREGVISRESTHLTLQTRGTRGIRCHLTPHAMMG